MRRDDSGLDALRMFLIAAAFAALLYVGYRSAIVLEDSTSSKQFGYIPDAPATRAFLKTLERPMFAEAGQDAIAKAKGVDTMLSALASRLAGAWDPISLSRLIIRPAAGRMLRSSSPQNRFMAGAVVRPEALSLPATPTGATEGPPLNGSAECQAA